MCVDSVFRRLNKVFDDSLRSKVLVITDNDSDRDFKIRAAYGDLRFSTYDIVARDKGLGLMLENKNIPFLFVLNEHLTVSKLFIPLKEDSDKTEEYLTYLRNHFLN